MCTRPQLAYLYTDGVVKKSFSVLFPYDGEPLSVLFNAQLALKPWKVRYRPDGSRLVGRLSSASVVPCGHCPDCLSARKRALAHRLIMENKANKSAGLSGYFITLTYRPEDCPPSVSKEACQKFLKLFRYYLGGNRRYFLTAEYGDKFKRPHYHALVWLRGSVDDVSRAVAKAWKYGFNQVQLIRGDGCLFYCARYALKKAVDKDCFSLWSKSLGGVVDKEFIRREKFLTYSAGKPLPLSRYYKTSKKVGLGPELVSACSSPSSSLSGLYGGFLASSEADFVSYCSSVTSRDEFLRKKEAFKHGMKK